MCTIMQTFWIVIISVLVLLGLVAIAFLLWYFSTKNPGAPGKPGAPGGSPLDPIGPGQPPRSPIISYGDTIKLISSLNGIALSVCGLGTSSDCSASYNVSLSTDTRLITQQWSIMSYQPNIPKTGPVRYGDRIIVKSLYIPSPGQYLATCGNTGDNCGVNVVCGRTTPDQASQTWMIVGGTVGAAVMANDIIQLKSEYSPTSYLSACGTYKTNGGVCGLNVSLGTNIIQGSSSWSITK